MNRTSTWCRSLAAIVLVAACSGNDGDASPTPEPAAAESPAVAAGAARSADVLPPLRVDEPAVDTPLADAPLTDPPRDGEPTAAATRPPETAEPAAPRVDPRLDAERDERRARYLDHAWRDLERLHRAIGDMGPHRNAAAALATAALAARGGEGAGALQARSAGYVRQALDACAGKWHDVDCERAALDLQRLALAHADQLPPPLGRRLRSETAVPAPPPGRDEIAAPWSFAQTENQRAVTIARSLAAHALAGSGSKPAARAWADYATAFLTAHDRQGWYEADSPGYLAISIVALLHLHDFAPDRTVRQLAGRQLNLLFADWALLQVGGMPAGARSRTYAHWALGTVNTPWRAWHWLLTGEGDPREISFGDWPEMPLSEWRAPAAVARLAAERREQGSYAVRERRRFDPARRQSVDAALYAWATPDYVLSASQAVDGLALAVSGGQEVSAWLLPEGGDYAPLFLWSRQTTSRAERWRSRAGLEQAVADENRLLARLGSVAEPGYAYLAPDWGRPEAVGETVLVARRGGTLVALVSDSGWQLAAAQERFPDYFGPDRAFQGAWVAVPRRQPAAVALVAGRASEVEGGFAAWKRRAAGLALAVEHGAGGEPVRLTLTGAGERFVFEPGRRATVGDRPVEARAYPLHSSPFLAHEATAGGAQGTWRFRHGGVDYRFQPLDPEPAAPRR